MISFECDYSEGAHPLILERLVETNMEQSSGYGLDPYTLSAKKRIREACSCPGADVFFLIGGTQTNATIIDSMLPLYGGVVSVETGHIGVHEAGAIEFTGHKVLTLPHHNGKMDSVELDKYLKDFFLFQAVDHMVIPSMVYISFPTEYGTIYSHKELREIKEVCRRYSLPLFIDGARLGYGLMSRESDVTLKDIARIADVFYIGGTKVGALFGEAVVFPQGNAPKHFMNIIKQHGALLAKGRMLGIQFDTLFTDNLYFRISEHAIDMAERLKKAFREKGYEFFIDSPTNQQFIILSEEQIDSIRRQDINFEIWEALPDGRSAVRFATSWATKESSIERLKEVI